MKKMLWILALAFLFLQVQGVAQPTNYNVQYTVYDDNANGPGTQTSSVATIGVDRFVALQAEDPDDNDLFSVVSNFLVGYWDADSGNGRVLSPINGAQAMPAYGRGNGQFTSWVSGLDQIQFSGAWQIASGGADNYIYVANNDDFHNILVFNLTETGLVTTDFRMETGSENIFAIEVDDNGYVYVCDYEGNGAKNNEIRIYAGIGAPNTTWGDFGGHQDAPVATVDLPDGIYQGMTVSGDGSALYVSQTSSRSIMKFTGSPTGGYTMDNGFSYTMDPGDVNVNGSGVPSVLGLAYMATPPTLVAAVDTFIHSGDTGGYSYGRVYTFNPATGAPRDTIDIAQWNFDQTGDYSTGSNNGHVGGFTSVCDVDANAAESAVYTQTYFGWSVEKWNFTGEVSIDPIADIIPTEFELRQNYPNPFNPETTIEFSVLEANDVALEIYNVLGQNIAVLVNDRLGVGTYKVTFDASNLPSGVYFYKLTAGNNQAFKKMLLTK